GVAGALHRATGVPVHLPGTATGRLRDHASGVHVAPELCVGPRDVPPASGHVGGDRLVASVRRCVTLTTPPSAGRRCGGSALPPPGGRFMPASTPTETPETARHHLRFHAPHVHLASAFGDDWFGVRAEGFARFFGTPTFLIGQTVVVGIWIALN